MSPTDERDVALGDADSEIREVSRRPSPIRRLRDVWTYRELLRNLVEQHRHRGRKSQRRAGQVACADQNAVDEVVDAVPEDVYGGQLGPPELGPGQMIHLVVRVDRPVPVAQ